jgi:hypothetical protein
LLATFLGWILDGFDVTITTFILIDSQESFTVDAALAWCAGHRHAAIPVGRRAGTDVMSA